MGASGSCGGSTKPGGVGSQYPASGQPVAAVPVRPRLVVRGQRDGAFADRPTERQPGVEVTGKGDPGLEQGGGRVVGQVVNRPGAASGSSAVRTAAAAPATAASAEGKHGRSPAMPSSGTMRSSTVAGVGR